MASMFDDLEVKQVQQPKKRFGQRAGEVLGSIFGGKQIGDLIGTKIAEHSPTAKALKNAPAIKQQGIETIPAGGNKPLFKTPTGKQLAGDAAMIASNFIPVGKAGKLLGSATKTVVDQGAKTFLKTAGKKAATNFALGEGLGTAQGLSEGKSVGESVKTGALTGAGLASFGIANSLLKVPIAGIAKNAEKYATTMFRSGLGFSKAQNKVEEATHNKAIKFLMEQGAGGADKLKNAYELGAQQNEQSISNILKGSKKEFAAPTVLNQIKKEFRRQFSKTLSGKEVDAIVDGLPLAGLRNKGFVKIKEVNEIRKQLGKFLTDSGWLKDQTKAGNVNQIRTASSVLSELVKNNEPATRPIFDEWSAYIKGLEGLLNRATTSTGPVNRGAQMAAQATGAALGAGAGAAVGGIPGAVAGGVAGLASEELARSTLGQTSLAVGLKKLGIGAEKFAALADNEKQQLINILIKMGIIKSAN